MGKVEIGKIAKGKHGFEVSFDHREFNRVAKGIHPIYIGEDSLNDIEEIKNIKDKEEIKSLKNLIFDMTHHDGALKETKERWLKAIEDKLKGRG
jgi:hypothetical protein